MLSFTKKRKINPMLMNVIIVSALIHVAVGVVLGGITIVRYVIPDDTKFEEPPVVEEEAPPPEVKVDIKQRPPQLDQSLNNLKMREVGNISVAAVDVDLPGMDQSFTVSSGLGGFGGGNLLGNTRGSLGIGMSDVSVFGLKTRAERILFAIDADRAMVADDKGGLNSYEVIKDEITDMVGNLSAGTLFNIMIYDGSRALFFKPQLIPAGAEVTEELKSWIRPINANAETVGLERTPGTQRMRVETLPESLVHRNLQGYERSELNMLLTPLILEQQIDAGFIITGFHRGFERIRRSPTPEEQQEWRETTSEPAYQEALLAHQREQVEMRQRIARKLAAINRERTAKGMPPRVLRSQGVNANANELDLEFENPHPGYAPAYYIEQDDVEDYIEDVVEVLYENRGGEPPSINVILFLAGDENFSEDEEDNLDDYTRFFDGDYRVIRGEDEVRDARSAQETRN